MYLAYDGGLEDHSLKVYHVEEHIAENMHELCHRWQIPKDCIIIISLLCDLCKAIRYYHSGITKGRDCQENVYDGLQLLPYRPRRKERYTVPSQGAGAY